MCVDSSLLAARWPDRIECPTHCQVAGEHGGQTNHRVSTPVSLPRPHPASSPDTATWGCSLLLRHTKRFLPFGPWHQLLWLPRRCCARPHVVDSNAISLEGPSLTARSSRPLLDTSLSEFSA